MEDCLQLTKVQLQDILRTAGKPISGNKPELCKRILDNNLSLTSASQSVGRVPIPMPVGVRSSPRVVPVMRPLSPPRAPVVQPGPQSMMQQEMERCNGLAYRDIQNELRKYNLKLTGKKEELCLRLAEYLAVGQARKQQGPLPAEVPLPTAPQVGLLKPKAFSLTECNHWTVAQLKDRLRQLGQHITGNKQELCLRLAEYEKAQLPPTKGVHNIVFLEAVDAEPRDIYRAKPIAINGRMYNFIREGPISRNQFQGRPCEGNSYVFGPLLDLDGYTLIGHHGNDAANTGFIDLDKVNQVNGSINTNFDDRDRIYRAVNYNWDDRDALRQLQQIRPFVLWLGETKGGDVGANLYAHYDKNGEIDSLIVDNNCLFPYQSEDA